MLATDGLARGDWAVSVPLAEGVLERYPDPEWHSLCLFGPGRHPGAFAAGVETRDAL